MNFTFVGVADHEMDGEAILMAGSSQSGPDCLTAVIPALGVRLKVYHTIKNTIEEEVLFGLN